MLSGSITFYVSLSREICGSNGLYPIASNEIMATDWTQAVAVCSQIVYFLVDTEDSCGFQSFGLGGAIQLVWPIQQEQK